MILQAGIPALVKSVLATNPALDSRGSHRTSHRGWAMSVQYHQPRAGSTKGKKHCQLCSQDSALLRCWYTSREYFCALICPISLPYVQRLIVLWFSKKHPWNNTCREDSVFFSLGHVSLLALRLCTAARLKYCHGKADILPSKRNGHFIPCPLTGDTDNAQALSLFTIVSLLQLPYTASWIYRLSKKWMNTQKKKSPTQIKANSLWYNGYCFSIVP